MVKLLNNNISYDYLSIPKNLNPSLHFDHQGTKARRDTKDFFSVFQSTALMARRKMGKTALMERLFNITFFTPVRLKS